MDVGLFARLVLAMTYRLPQCKNAPITLLISEEMGAILYLHYNWSWWPQEKKFFLQVSRTHCARVCYGLYIFSVCFRAMKHTGICCTVTFIMNVNITLYYFHV